MTVADDSVAFYSRAIVRIRSAMFATTALAAIAFVFFDWRFAAGFVLGAAVAIVNIHWLERTVSALADRVTGHNESGQPLSPERARSKGAWLVLRFVLRYALIGAAAYVIFKGSVLSGYGLLAGLFVPVAALFWEAAYEAWAALRHGL